MMSRYMIPLQTNQSEIVASAQIKDTSIPWKITVPFDEQNHLFYQTVQTDYSIDGYICSCGEQKLILRHHNQEEQFVCELCGNEIFYDAIYALDHVASSGRSWLCHGILSAFLLGCDLALPFLLV